MENTLLKKSFRVKDLKTISFNSLWGYKGIFTTIRLIGNKPNLILVEEHLKKLNKDIQYFGINFKISKQFLIKFIKNNSKIKSYDHLLRVAITKKILSLSLRKRIKEDKFFTAQIYRYQRVLPAFKNLQYKKFKRYWEYCNCRRA